MSQRAIQPVARAWHAPFARLAGCSGRLFAAAVVVAMTLLAGALPAGAETTTVELPASVTWGVASESTGPSEYEGEAGWCDTAYTIRFPARPGHPLYKLSWLEEERKLERSGPASSFPGTLGPPQYPPAYSVLDAPAGDLEFVGTVSEDSQGFTEPGKTLATGCEESKPFYEEHVTPTDIQVTATETSWEVSGRLLSESCEGCEKTGIAGAKVIATGTSEIGEAITETATSDAQGNWHMVLPQGTYGIAPEGSGWLPHEDSATLKENVTQMNFTHGEFTLSGKVLGVDGKGQPGATVLLSESGQALKTTTTDGEGHFSEKLPMGTVQAAVAKLNGTEFFPDPSENCLETSTTLGSTIGPVGSDSCEVNLNKDREIAFSACVLPNPDGAPLPANTPEQIPGAVTAGQLEAVGCWKPQNAKPGGEATVYTSTQPVRLNGIDVAPSPGTTLQLDTASGPTVTSNGPAQLLIDGWKVTPPLNISLNYQTGSQLSVSDQGQGTGPLAPNLFGLPISLGTGGPAGYGLPFSESRGQTSISGGLQIPANTHAVWDVAAGVFKEPEAKQVFVPTGSTGGTVLDHEETVPSLGLGGSIVLTNRQGLTVGNLCLSINDLATDKLIPFLPDGYNDGEISGAQVCWKPTQELWEGTGMFKMPTAIARYVGDIYVKLVAQKAKPDENSTYTGTPQFAGYKIQRFGLQFEHLNSQTYVVPETASVRSSGIPLGLGFYLQSLGGEFSNDLTTSKVSEIKGTMGISYGPEVNVQLGQAQGNEFSLLRGDLELALLPSGPEISYWTYKLAGALTFARLTPLELQLGAAEIAYHANPTAPEADFSGRLGGSLLSVGGALTVNGQSDVPNGLLLEGIRTVKAFGHQVSFDATLNNYLLGVCFSENGSPVWGFDENLANLLEPATWGCNLGKFKHPKGGSASAVTHVSHLRLRRGLRGIVLAVRGTSSAPAVRLSGPGSTITAIPTLHPHQQGGALVFADPAKHTTYIGLISPRAGAWTVRALGSSAIAEVLQAEPGHGPRVKAKVVRAGCEDKLRYRARATDGEKIVVYAQQGAGHVYVGTLHAGSGTLKLGLLPRVKGHGKLVAYFLRGKLPEGSATLASFADAASNGSERPSHLKAHAGTLRWKPACDAASYTVAVKRGGKTTSESTVKPQLALPAGRGAATVTVTALTKGDVALGSIQRKLK